MNQSGWHPILVFFLGLCALTCFFRWRRWKQRARKSEQDLRIWKDALHSVGFETTNAVNAIRANLLDFRQVNPSVAMPEHLDEIETGTQRISRILEIVEDPVAWRRQKNNR